MPTKIDINGLAPTNGSSGKILQERKVGPRPDDGVRRGRPSAPGFHEASHEVRDVRNRKSRRRVLVALVVAAELLLAVMTSGAFAADSGREDFLKKCAGCHGADGKGKGPSLYVMPGIHPVDLTVLSKHNGGVFPFQEVEDVIDGRKEFPDHERLDMPFWGVDLQEPGKESTPEGEARVKARIDAMVRYLESIQEK